MDETKVGSNKNFGIVFFVVFILIAVYPLVNDGEIRKWSLIISLGTLGLTMPSPCLSPFLWFPVCIPVVYKS